MEIDRDIIMDDLEEIQEQIDGMGFCGSNEKELWTREAIADYVVKKFNISSVSKSFYCVDVKETSEEEKNKIQGYEYEQWKGTQ